MKQPQFPIATLPITSLPLTTTSTSGTSAPTSDSVAAAKAPQVVQPAFPQGSILVMPHPQHPFHAVPLLPVFANTAVIMPQNSGSAGQQAVGIEMHVSDAVSASSTLSNENKIETITATSAVQSIPGANSNSADKTLNSSQNQTIVSEAGNKGVAAALPTAVDFRHAFAIAGFPSPHAFALPVTDPVELAKIDFNSKSIEITGEVPIRKIELKPEEIEAAKMAAAAETNERDVDGGLKESPATHDKKHVGEGDGSTQLSGAPGVAHGSHTSTEVMSAKMLLSLKGKDWQVSPHDKEYYI